MLRRLSPCVFVLLAFSTLRAVQPAPDAGVITGRVVEQGTNTPVEDARVFLFPMSRPPDGRPPQQHQETSRADGSFRFEGLAPGRYGVRAEKTGYAMPGPGSGAPPMVVLEAGRPGVAPVVLLQRGGVVAGRVLSPGGEPVLEARVTALRRGPGALAGRLMMGGPGVATNDLGEFRLHSLAPGDYYIQASPRFESPNVRNTPATTRIAPTFYPGTTDVAAAQTVTIAAGATLNGIEIGMLRAPTFSISGVVVDEDERPVENALIVLASDPAQGIFTFTPPSQTHAATDGSFALEGILSGSYRLSAAAPSLSKSERIGGSGAIVPGTSSGAFGGQVGRLRTETRNGVTTEYVFDPTAEVRVVIDADHVSGVQVIARRR